jgi:hypothetical protein
MLPIGSLAHRRARSSLERPNGGRPAGRPLEWLSAAPTGPSSSGPVCSLESAAARVSCRRRRRHRRGGAGGRFYCARSDFQAPNGPHAVSGTAPASSQRVLRANSLLRALAANCRHTEQLSRAAREFATRAGQPTRAGSTSKYANNLGLRRQPVGPRAAVPLLSGALTARRTRAGRS